MATLISDIETTARLRLNEVSARFWTSAELVDIIIAGIKDLWRDVVDLKQEHFLTVDTTNVSYAANATSLTGVPADVHKVYMIEPLNLSSTNSGLQFVPLDYNHPRFQAARAMSAIDPASDAIFYCITGAGTPVGAPTILCAPKVTSAVSISFVYVPSVGTLTSASTVPIPGESQNALVAWTVAFARAKERDDRSPDPSWLIVYATEKQHILQSLGMREYQEPQYVDALFEDF